MYDVNFLYSQEKKEKLNRFYYQNSTHTPLGPIYIMVETRTKHTVCINYKRLCPLIKQRKSLSFLKPCFLYILCNVYLVYLAF